MPKKYTIFGKGFGLYGYLPALIESGNTEIILHEDCKKIIANRQDLKDFFNSITWSKSYSRILESVNSIVIAVPPLSQEKIILEIIKNRSINNFIIEKPISVTPRSSMSLIQELQEYKKNFRVNYILLYTDWYKDLKKACKNNNGILKINWSFKAHHFENKLDIWKRYHSMGGGVIRFYGIHIIALLTSLGIYKTETSFIKGSSNDQPDSWIATFSNKECLKCRVSIFTNSNKESFKLSFKGVDPNSNFGFESTSPFGDTLNGDNHDSRVPYLKRFISSFDDVDINYENLYKVINNLWQEIEFINTSDIDHVR